MSTDDRPFQRESRRALARTARERLVRLTGPQGRSIDPFAVEVAPPDATATVTPEGRRWLAAAQAKEGIARPDGPRRRHRRIR